MILYTENPKDSIRKLLELISELKKLQDIKSIYRNHLYFYILFFYMKNQKEKLRNQSHSPLQQKEYLGINLPKETKELYPENYKTLMKPFQWSHMDVRVGL